MFSDISRTTPEGVVLSVDTDDWRTTPGTDGEPSAVIVLPAAPNPATSVANLPAEIGGPDEITVEIQKTNSDAQRVTLLRDVAISGRDFSVRVDQPDSAPGLYRVYITGRTFSTYGDVRFE